jgi:hypothetical protein
MNASLPNPDPKRFVRDVVAWYLELDASAG